MSLLLFLYGPLEEEGAGPAPPPPVPEVVTEARGGGALRELRRLPLGVIITPSQEELDEEEILFLMRIL